MFGGTGAKDAEAENISQGREGKVRVVQGHIRLCSQSRCCAPPGRVPSCLPGAGGSCPGWGDLLVISRVPLMQHSHIGTLGSLAASLGWGLRWAPEQEIRVRRRGGKNPQNPHGAGSRAAQLMGLPWRRSSEEEEKAENSPMLG